LNVHPWIKNYHGQVLILSTLFLFCVGGLYNIPYGLLALLGLYNLIRKPVVIAEDENYRLTTILFLCIWVPMVLSLIDAEAPGHSAKTVISYTHFFFAGLYIIELLKKQPVRQAIQIGTFVILTFWAIDAFIQYLAGVNLLGKPAIGNQLTGMFYPKMRVGLVLAVFLPVYLGFVLTYSGKNKWLWLLLIPLFVVIIFSNKRSAWLMAILGLSACGLYLCLRDGMRIFKKFAVPALVVITVAAAFIVNDEAFRSHVKRTAGLASNDYELMDIATSRRMSLWSTSMSIFSDHWLNGIGPRGFRHVYLEYANPDNFFVQEGRRGQTHPHLFVMEIATETGIVGLTGIIFFWLFFLWKFGSVWRKYDVLQMAWLLSGMVAFFPLNAHFAFYGTFWSSVSWLILAIAMGMANFSTNGRSEERQQG